VLKSTSVLVIAVQGVIGPRRRAPLMAMVRVEREAAQAAARLLGGSKSVVHVRTQRDQAEEAAAVQRQIGDFAVPRSQCRPSRFRCSATPYWRRPRSSAWIVPTARVKSTRAVSCT